MLTAIADRSFASLRMTGGEAVETASMTAVSEKAPSSQLIAPRYEKAGIIRPPVIVHLATIGVQLYEQL